MAKHIQNPKTGKMAGSIGDGKTHVPTASITLPQVPPRATELVLKAELENFFMQLFRARGPEDRRRYERRLAIRLAEVLPGLDQEEGANLALTARRADWAASLRATTQTEELRNQTELTKAIARVLLPGAIAITVKPLPDGDGIQLMNPIYPTGFNPFGHTAWKRRARAIESYLGAFPHELVPDYFESNYPYYNLNLHDNN